MARSVVSDLAGRVLAGRYVLQAAIGTGASGRVYVAQDVRLQRRVAVKVLHAALAEDAAFLRRFRAEAQLAASLHHPHIVTVHDWGDDDMPFVVLELLAGGSLRSLLDESERLSVAQAARIGRDVASALEYAHARGILHRDVKPANLLFDEHGIVRVADFGLARALAEASWTEPQGAVFGTARYASPEQAMGAQLDARSDLYSLALVLVEAVTGEVPFASDTTIGTLTARTRQTLTAPPALGPLTPVVERAGRIDMDERYPDAATMRAALADVADALPPPAPLRLAGMSDHTDPHPTQARTQRAEPPPLFDQDAVEVLPDPAEPAEPMETSTTRRLVPFVVAAVLALTVALAAVAFARVGGTPVEVPGLVGRSLDDARALAASADLEADVVATEHAPDPAGTVIEQTPSPGAFTRDGAVGLVVSDGPEPVEVPNVVGLTQAEAEPLLATAGFPVEPVREYRDDVPPEVVAEIAPAPGERVPPETVVRIVVSRGPAPVEIPDVRGVTFTEAQSALVELGFQVSRTDDFSDDVPADQVIGTNPEIGVEAPFGSQVTVVVSKGPDLVEVPDVRGMSLDEAGEVLEDADFDVELEGPFRRAGEVRFQDPEPGTLARRGSTVTVRLQVGDDD